LQNCNDASEFFHLYTIDKDTPFSAKVKTILHNLKYILIIRVLLNWWLDIILSYDLENTIGYVLYRAATAFRKALDLELPRKAVVTFGQWLRSSATATTIQLVKNNKRGSK
jgi:hypothetical protein